MTLKSDEEREPIWYIMDEFGSSIRHSNDPSVECMPFYYVPTATMYSIVWPRTNLSKGGYIYLFSILYFIIFKLSNLIFTVV